DAQGRRVAPRHPPAPRARQQRGPHGEARGRPSPQARPRGEDRRGEDRRRRRAARWPARPRRRPARRHGRAPRHRAGEPPLQVHRAHHVQRAGRGGDARVRARHAHRHAHGRRRGAGRRAGPAPRHGEVHLPAGRGGAAARRDGRREADDRRGRPREPGAGGDLRAARGRRPAPRGPHLLPPRGRDGQRRRDAHGGARPADPRRAPLERRRPHRRRVADRARHADRREPAGGPHREPRGGHGGEHPGRRAQQHRARQRGDARDDPHLRHGDARHDPRARAPHRRPHRPLGRRHRRGVVRQQRARHLQRPGAHCPHAPDAAPRRRRAQRVGGAADHRRRGLRLLRAEDPGALRLPRRRARRHRPDPRRAQPLAQLLRRRVRAPQRRQDPRPPRRRLPRGAGTAVDLAPV
ncbi:MAG: N-acyl-L-amino acid amidohydrolase, partial [uncultured Gemmatimonadaceae bacterium]